MKNLRSHRCAFGCEIKYPFFCFAGIALLLFFLHPSFIYAQQNSLPIKPRQEAYYFDEVKFPGNEPIRDVVDLVEDSRGFIWMASRHGLIRYDGHDFKVFRHNAGDNSTLADTELWALHILGDSLLCVDTTNGISLLNLRDEKITNLLFDQYGNSISVVSCFYIDRDGQMWIGGLKGLYSIQPNFSGIINHDLQTPPLVEGDPAFRKRVYGITDHVADENLLMLATECGLMSFDKKHNRIHKLYPNTEATFHRSLPGVYKFFKEGRFLWTMSWVSGFPRFDMMSEKWENHLYPDEKTQQNIWTMSSFLPANEDEIWLCDRERGVFKFDKRTKQRLPIAGSCEVMTRKRLRIFMQPDSTLWLANGEGLWRQNRAMKQFCITDIPFEGQWVLSHFIEEEQNDFYFGLVHKSYGLACWNPGAKKWTLLKTETDPKKELGTYVIKKDSYGDILAGTSRRGIWRVDRNVNLLRRYTLSNGQSLNLDDETIYAIFEDSKRNLWIGTRTQGVMHINPERTKVVHHQHNPKDSLCLMDGARFRAIEEDKYGRIWFGNQEGFCIYDPENGSFSQELTQKLYGAGIRVGHTYSIVRDNVGAMWMTIVGQGLLRIEENEKNKFRFKIFQTDHGLKDLTVKFMTKDHLGNLWIVNNGLLYFNPYDFSYMHVDEGNGLLENIAGDAQIVVDKQGNVFTDVQVGLNWLGEVKKQSQSKVSNLIIESVLVKGSPIQWSCGEKKTLQLSTIEGENNIVFQYSAICFDEYAQVRYRYKLEGLESDWNVPTKQLQARYTNLKPGKYRFVVDAAYIGTWLGFNEAVDLKITQVFWKTPWFVGLIFLVLALMAYTFHRNKLRERYKLMQMRQKIACDLHDDVGSTLSSISIMSDLLQSKNNVNPASDEIIRQIGHNAHTMLESMDDIIWAVNPANDKFENLVYRIKEYAYPLFEAKDIRSTINMAENLLPVSLKMDFRRNIFLIAKEAINNLVKYSECNEAVIDFRYSHDTLVMKISDNGKGFNVAEKHNRNGIVNMKSRAQQIGGKVTIRSSVGNGTSVTLAVKL